MRIRLLALLIGLAPVLSLGAERPDWAFPVADKVQPRTKEDDQPKTLPRSTKSYTQKQIDDLKNPPDWFPDMHPPMPPIVAHGTTTFACGSCHLPAGTGHDESAYLAGLPASYIVGQMADFKSGTRKGFGVMPDIAQALSDADVQAAASYFTSVAVRPWVRVVETDTVPKTYVNLSNMRLALPSGGSEPIGNRIIELPEDEAAAVARDPRSGFVAYVPKGSIAKGQTLVMTDGSDTTACVICHGPALKGLGATPAIAGRHTGYLVRQLYFFQNGDRSGAAEALMRNVVRRLTDDDMVAITAYVASLQP
ncbi:MAG TPA: c-type cytochrome [Xanthobacteraceae bacterium]|jgi:cytochrome c553